MFLKGLILGFSIAAPVGPIGVLCIRRTLLNGQLAGFLSGLGAATADAFYGAIAAFGLTLISAFLISQQQWVQLIGGGFLVYLGLKYILSKPPAMNMQTVPTLGASAYLTTFFLTLTNPMTILSFAAAFAGLGLVDGSADALTAGAMVTGVFLGSAAWWLLLSGGVSLFRQRINQQALGWINRFSGLVIMVFGLIALISSRGWN